MSLSNARSESWIGSFLSIFMICRKIFARLYPVVTTTLGKVEISGPTQFPFGEIWGDELASLIESGRGTQESHF